MAAIRNNVTKTDNKDKVGCITEDPSKLDIFDNHNEFKAYIMLMGNKQYLHKLFDRKSKQAADTITKQVASTTKQVTDHKSLGKIAVSAEVQTASKRKREPKGSPLSG